MKNNNSFLLLILLVSTTVFSQDYIYKNQNEVMGSMNPSFYGFGDSSKAGIIYGTEGFNQNSKLDNRFAYVNHFFENYDFSLALDVNTLQIGSLGYSITSSNLHYIYKTKLNEEWVFNPSVSVGYGNTALDYNSLIFEDQLNALTGSIAGVSNDPIKVNNKVNFFDVGAGVSFYNTGNVLDDIFGEDSHIIFGANLKHINRPETSFNTNKSNLRDMFVSMQIGGQFDINKYDQGFLPYYSYLYLYNTFSKQGSKSRIDLYQEAILGNVGFGINQHFNNYDGFSVNQFGTSLNIYIEEIQIGANYSFEMGRKVGGSPYNTFEMYIIFDFNPFKKNRRGDNSKFFDMQ